MVSLPEVEAASSVFAVEAQAARLSAIMAASSSARYFFMFSSSCDACASCVLFCMLIIIHVECIMSRETE